MLNAELENLLNGYDAAVTVEFNDVFAGVGAGGLHQQQQGFVDRLLAVGRLDVAVEDAVAFPGLMAGGAEDALGNGDGADAGESDDADAALLRHDGGGDRGDGFGLVDRLKGCRRGTQGRFGEFFVKLREFVSGAAEYCYRIMLQILLYCYSLGDYCVKRFLLQYLFLC